MGKTPCSHGWTIGLMPDRHRAVLHALKSGKLVRPDTCQCCRRSKDHPEVVAFKGGHYQAIQAHHVDPFLRPLEVVWVCIQCHHHLEICGSCGYLLGFHCNRDTHEVGRNPVPYAKCEGWRPAAPIGGCKDGSAPWPPGIRPPN